MEVRQISNDNWLVEVTDENKKRFACIINKLKSKTELPSYGKWKNMKSEDISQEIRYNFLC